MRLSTSKGQSKMDNPEKLATLGTQDTGRRQKKQKYKNKNKNKKHTTIRKQTQNNVNKTWSFLQTTGDKEEYGKIVLRISQHMALFV